MGDSDDENYVTFGIALDPLDEENLPRKKAVTIEDQYAYDAQGRRRFHGAFTGGFSAGYFNTVGTRDGWKPQQFKSSRSSKAGNITQRPEDFMDEEDTSQFGIAPTGIRTTDDYANHEQRGVKRERYNRESSGPIPGAPVLKELLKPVKDTVGITLLKKMGWRPGQGVGSRLTKKEKAKVKERNARIQEQYSRERASSVNSSDDSEDDHQDITFAPDDYEPFRCNPKDNFFGIGYSGLERRNILSNHINLFDAPAFKLNEKNKKLSIHGQAFGVGAFEADDEDIYAKDDMSRYDFALGPEHKPKSRWSDGSSSKNSASNCLEGFACGKSALQGRKSFPLPEIPNDFAPVHITRKSRFYPPIENVPQAMENGRRKVLTAVDRAKILSDTDNFNKVSGTASGAVPSASSNIIIRTLNLHGKNQAEERLKMQSQTVNTTVTWMDKLNEQNFIKGGIVGTSKTAGLKSNTVEDLENSASSEVLPQADESVKDDANLQTVKPFIADPDKQQRFEQYVIFLKNGEKQKLESIQPLSMTEWDRDHERIEFEQAAKLFESLPHEATNRFVHASDSSAPGETSPIKSSQDSEMKDAAKMKMFGKLTRERIEWRPASIVCKRFNIPEPKVGCAAPELQKKSNKFAIFDSLDWSSASKFAKATDAVSKSSNEVLASAQIGNELAPYVVRTNIEILSAENVKEPMSDKERHFEASYEKVFGRGMQETTVNVECKTDAPDVEESELDAKEGASIQSLPLNHSDESSFPILPGKTNTEEKKDLFKAIFLSSSEESESEPEENMDSEALKSVLIGKKANDLNTQRNTSPPRGIFAKVDLDNLMTSPQKSDVKPDLQSTLTERDKDNSKIEESQEMSLPLDMYGPALPARLIKTENATSAEESTSQTQKPVFRSVVVPKLSRDKTTSGKWVEAEKLKKSKKEKKKHKHKEHKSSKHKRKSKKDKR